MLFVHPLNHTWSTLRKTLSRLKKITSPRKQHPRGSSLAKWKLLNRSKTKEEIYYNRRKIQEQQESEEKQPREEIRETPITEYSETLYSDGFGQKQPTNQTVEKKPFFRRTRWENTDTIEQYVDTMQWKQKEPTRFSHQPLGDTNKKVDYILLKKKRKP